MSENTEDPVVDELVESFKKLLHNVNGDKETLIKLQDDVLNEEVERVSPPNSRGSETMELFTTVGSDDPSDDAANSTVVGDLEGLVSHVKTHFAPEKLDEISVYNELENMFINESGSKKYMWLTNSITPYNFGGRTYKPRNMNEFSEITKIMDLINHRCKKIFFSGSRIF